MSYKKFKIFVGFLKKELSGYLFQQEMLNSFLHEQNGNIERLSSQNILSKVFFNTFFSGVI